MRLPCLGKGIPNARLRDGVFAVLALHGRRRGVYGPLIDSGAVVLAILQQIIPLDDLCGVAGFTAEDRGKGRLAPYSPS